MRHVRTCQRWPVCAGAHYPMRVLITGASGLLGGRLAECLSSRFDVVAGCHRAPPPTGLETCHVDLRSTTELSAAIDRVAPDAIVHCAALADAERCQHALAEAEALNVVASHEIAKLSQRAGIRLRTLSTDLVFDGTTAPYREDAPAQPLLTYGQTKLRGEQRILAESPSAAIARVALVVGRGFGPRGTASEAIAWRLAAGQPLRLYHDQYRTPVDADSVADAVARLLVGGQAGRFHLGGHERVSRFELGQRVACVLGLRSDTIERVRQTDMAMAAQRPADVSLDSSRAQRELGWVSRSLDEAIRAGRPATRP
jgi:dTDP-4-dehydrorhamnose reductase